MLVSTRSGVVLKIAHDPVMFAWKASFQCLFPPGQVLLRRVCMIPSCLRGRPPSSAVSTLTNVGKNISLCMIPSCLRGEPPLQCWFQELPCGCAFGMFLCGLHIPHPNVFLCQDVCLVWFLTLFAVPPLLCGNDVAVRFKFSALFGTVYRGRVMAGLVCD